MGKVLVRLTVIFVAIYFIISYIVAQVFGVNILTSTYVLLFELIAVVYCYSEGRYHCKYMKSTALAILLSDAITRLDYYFDFLPTTAHNIMPIVVFAVGISVSLYKAIKHFSRINGINAKRERVNAY